MRTSNKWRTLVLAVFFLAGLASCCYAQGPPEGHDCPELWQLQEISEYQNEHLVAVLTPWGDGCGAVIYRGIEAGEGLYWGLVATAAHVVEQVPEGQPLVAVQYSTKLRAGGVVVGFKMDRMKDHDVALILAKVPNEINPAKLASRENSAERGDLLTFVGLGGMTNGVAHHDQIDDRYFEPRVFQSRAIAGTQEDHIASDTYHIPGDSGGPVYNEANEIVGILNGGSLGWNTHENIQTRYTGPGASTGSDLVHDLLDKCRQWADTGTYVRPQAEPVYDYYGNPVYQQGQPIYNYVQPQQQPCPPSG